MTMQFTQVARQAAADGAISADEIVALRRAGWPDGMQLEEVEAIFALNDALAERSAAWADFFVEAIGDYLINGTLPRGYVSAENAAWLIAQVDRDGTLQGLTELELLVRVLERSTNTPEALKKYVLDQVEEAVLTGSGPTRRGGELAPGEINAAEAAILRRVLFAPAGDAPAAVSAREAELLFRLKDASLGKANAPEWKRLFVQGVGNYLAGSASPSAQLSRERAAELETFMNDAGSHGVGRFLSRALRGTREALDNLPAALRLAFAGENGRDRFAELAAGEEVTGEERAWLDGHVGADGRIDEYEQALLDFLAEG